MKNTKKINTLSLRDLLFEQEEEAEETPDEETAEETEADDDGGEAEETAEEEKDGDSDEVVVSSEPSIDGEIQAVLIDFETSARKSAVSEQKTVRSLYESEELFDLDNFTADVARLVKNYDNLIDMEALLVNKTKEFLQDRYGDEVVDQFLDKLEAQHDIEEPAVSSPLPSSGLETPLAVGAGATGE